MGMIKSFGSGPASAPMPTGAASGKAPSGALGPIQREVPQPLPPDAIPQALVLQAAAKYGLGSDKQTQLRILSQVSAGMSLDMAARIVSNGTDL